MKTMIRTLLAFFFLLVSVASAADQAPDFSLPGKDGASVHLADLRGKVVYVDFWASWCGPCRHSFPWMNELQTAYGDKGLAIVAINLDQERDLADKFLEAMKPKFTIAFDPQGGIAEKYKVQGMPTSFLIDRSGTIHSRHMGFRDSELPELNREIKALVGAK